MHYAPYTYVQQPQLLEEKTILRKKFSWKHYPELERFLIANRDEYLRHSSMNYTAEQKQYNNWLTEQLLAVAAEHHYVFDQEEFNFVAIRDRIRCYYKSYVQTARKRGQNLPTTPSSAAGAVANSVTPSHSREEEEDKSAATTSKEKGQAAALPFFKSAAAPKEKEENETAKPEETKITTRSAAKEKKVEDADDSAAKEEEAK